MSLGKNAASIKRKNNFLITVHTSPEGDALGSELGFYNLVKKMGKRATIINEDPLPYGYDFLPRAARITRLDKKSAGVKFDCFVVLDCADLKRTGEVYKLNENKPILNIDHHISNRIFGDVNWVDPQASSCSEMIYRLFKYMRRPIDQGAALALYTGIVTDTGSFRYSNTSGFTHKAAAELLKFNIDVRQVYRNTYENIPLSDAKLLIKLFSTLKFSGGGRIAWFKIKADLFRDKKPCIDLADQLLTFGRAIKGVDVVVIFKENLGAGKEVRVNLRSQGKVDVNKIANLFGGGGHAGAAGCTVSGTINQARARVIARLLQSL